jgi:hypothetical protein
MTNLVHGEPTSEGPACALSPCLSVSPMRRMHWGMAAGVVVLVSLGGCVSLQPPVQSRYAILAQEATAEDRLPAEPYDGAYELIDVESARYGGEAAGVQLWIAVGARNTNVCVVVLPENPSGTVATCGGDAPIGHGEAQLSMGVTGGPEVHLLTDGEPQVDTTGWQQVSENLWVE